VAETPPRARLVDVGHAAELLRLSERTVRELAAAGYVGDARPGEDRFVLGDVKALHARLTDTVVPADPSASPFDRLDPIEAHETGDLLDALVERGDEMADRAFAVFATIFPEATTWEGEERERFVEQARRRFEAILAVASHGEDLDLTTDLEEVGAAAAGAGSSLPQLLIVLRISRDLVVQTAVELAESRGRAGGLALGITLTRVLPAIDRLTDAIAAGYWAALVGREEEHRARHESVVEHASDGVYELDVDGRVRYANPSLAIILGRALAEVEGAPITDVLQPIAGDALSLLTDPSRHAAAFLVRRPDGVDRVLDVRTLVRRSAGVVVGYQGVVRDVTAAVELEASRRELLAGITGDLGAPLADLDGVGRALESGLVEGADARRLGAAVRASVARLTDLAGDLDGVSVLEVTDLAVAPGPVDLAAQLTDAVAAVPGAEGVVVQAPPGVAVHADGERLAEVVVALVTNALAHGAPPVVVEAHRAGPGRVEILVCDRGPGVPPEKVPTLFAYRRRCTDPIGRGLSQVRALVEAMGGRVGYEPAPGGGSCFRIVLPTPQLHGAG
jgi:PAS domain S-box-containing protein